ncbi:MAG: class I SAM-dependent methyltransferase [Bacteroidia bacterium]|nr:class I SAM-dependent methyltransferase [Bacteroidia bacterium]
MNWFESWFNSPYYSILYRHRNEEEAAKFIQELVKKLSLPTGAKVLDLACGTGRHSILLAKSGLEVTGIDLSPQSIQRAIESAEKENLTIQFSVQDMRHLVAEPIFDIVLNLFTSFGYFENDWENWQVLKAVYEALRPGGIFVLDYLNPVLVAKELSEPVFGTDEWHGIQFQWQKQITGKFVQKSIQVIDQQHTFSFEELVQLISAEQFRTWFQAIGFKEIDCWGNYSGDQFFPDNSIRMIFILQKV